MVERLPESSGKVIGFKMSGKLRDEDYEQFVPQVEKVIDREGKARMLAWFHEFHGWDMPALWDDIKFATKHCTDIERIALVGEKQWERWMATVCKPFTLARVRYFDAGEVEAAWCWLRE
jgi:hypothetical protein